MVEQVSDGTPSLAPLLKEADPVLDDPVSHVLGNMGMWQLRAIVLVALVKVPAAWHMANILFVAPNPRPGQFWCARPALDSHWLGALPSQLPRPLAQMDPCTVYHNTTEDWYPNNMSTPTINTSTIPCSHFEFKKTPQVTNTAVMQWQLVCERQVLAGVSQFFYLLGILVGGFLCWKLLFRYSPRKIILCGMMIQVVAGTSMAYIPQFECHVALRFISAVAVAHMFTSGYIICTDITHGKWRTVVGACYEHMWSIGVITLPILSGLFSDWRDLQVAISLPTGLLIMAYRWVPDSPRWLLAHGYVREAQTILKAAAVYNGSDVSRIDGLSLTMKRNSPSEVRWTALFRPPNSKLCTFALHVIWAVTVASYYEGLLNVKNLGDNLNVNVVIAGVAEIVGVLLGLRLLLFPKKWPALCVILLAGGLSCFVCWLLPLHEPWVRDGVLVLLAMIGRIAIACSLVVLQEGSQGLLPQEYRPLCILSCVTFSRSFLLVTLLFVASLAEYGECGPLSAFGVFSVLGGFASLLLEYHSELQTESSSNSQVGSSMAKPPAVDKTTDSTRL